MPAIRQQINIAASPRVVWRALTTAEGLKSWWVDEARVDGRTGGRVVVVSEDDEGEPVEEAGVFLEFRPTRKIEIAWDSTGTLPTRGSNLQFQIATAEGETRVVLVHSGGADMDDEDVCKALNKAWKGALRSLRDSLEEQ
jgi:uncharacterized protein YndB with AHSA1/START domain